MYWYNKNRNDMEKKMSKDRQCNDRRTGCVLQCCFNQFNFITSHKALSINISTERRRNVKRTELQLTYRIAYFTQKVLKIDFFLCFCYIADLNSKNIVRRKDWRNMIVNKATFALFLWKCHIRIISNLIHVSAFLFW